VDSSTRLELMLVKLLLVVVLLLLLLMPPLELLLLLELSLAIRAMVLRFLDMLLLLGSVGRQIENRLASATLVVEVDGHRERGRGTEGQRGGIV
jgi:hypothetical protein